VLCGLIRVEEINVTPSGDGRSEKYRQNCGRKPEVKILLGNIGVDGPIVSNREDGGSMCPPTC
jgi:hypothetical protein